MASIYTGKQAPIRGPYVKQAFAKSIYKGEDAWLQQRDVQVPASGGNASVDIFGVFDGHGGKQAAVYASKHMMGAVLSALDQHIGKDEQDCQAGASDSMSIPTKHAPDSNLEVSAEEQLADCDVVKPEERALWRAQDALVEAMPHALSEAFQKVEADFFEHTKVSGSTATVAALSGWEVVIANVGDSCAYLDTGGEVVLVSGNHRLDDNKAERARCLEAGCEVSSSNLEGRPVGPLRVWPGGLAMSRTLGDHEAGAVVTAEPEVRQVTLPVGGGRLVLASDGLWDAVNPKTALHHVRASPASKAANELVQLALKSKGLRDDITVLVIDALPSEELRTPPALQRRNRQPIISRSAGAGSMSGEELMEAMSGGLTDQITVLRPLEQSSHEAHWRRTVWERRLAAVQTTYGALLPAPSLTYSDMSTTIALSDAAMASSFEVASMMADDTGDSSPNGASADHLLFGSFDDDEQEAEDEWETVPTKSKGRKHSAEPDASMAAPPPKELRAADGLSADAAPPATEGGTFVAVAPQGGPGRPRGPRDRDGRRGRGRGRGGAVARQQRMMRIEEGPEGYSPIRARPAGAASGPQDSELGQYPRGPPRRRERRARPARPPGSDQPLQEGFSGAPAFLPEANGAMVSGLDGAGKPHMPRQQPRRPGAEDGWRCSGRQPTSACQCICCTLFERAGRVNMLCYPKRDLKRVLVHISTRSVPLLTAFELACSAWQHRWVCVVAIFPRRFFCCEQQRVPPLWPSRPPLRGNA